MGKRNDSTVSRLCRRLAVRFRQAELLETALTHRSAGAKNNERLEFLGDALLNCVIAAALYRLCPELSEGDLSRLRASLVRESTLAELANEIELGDCIRLGPGESGSQRRASILADTFEAVLGAIYLDAGYPTVQQVIEACFAERLDNLPDPETLKDPKTRLQEYLQARSIALPSYHLISSSGPAHKRHFVIECTIADTQWSTQGEGSSRRKAEQAAARAMLEQCARDA